MTPEGVVILVLVLAVVLQYVGAVAVYLDARRHGLDQAGAYYHGVVYVPLVGLIVLWAYWYDRSRLLAGREEASDESA